MECQRLRKKHPGRCLQPTSQWYLSEPIPLSAKAKGTASPSKKSSLFTFSQLISVGEMASLAIQTIVGVCLADGLLMKAWKKSVLTERFLVDMWNITLWEQLIEPNRYSALQRNQRLASGKALLSTETQVMIEIPHRAASKFLLPMNLP